MAVKSSLRSDKALKGGFGIQEGIVRLFDTVFKIVQHAKKDGSLVTPYMAMQPSCIKLDEKGNDDGTPDTKDFIVCWGSKAEDGETGLHTFKFHPGKVDGPTDTEPEDMGAQIGAEGNTFVSDEEAYPFDNTDANLLMKCLERRGFKAEINDQCYAPNYDGLVIEVKTVKKVDLCKELKIKYDDQAGKEPAMVWDVVKIVVNPHDKSSKGKGAGAGTTAKGASGTGTSAKANGKAATPAAGGGDSGGDSKEAAMEAAVKTYAESHAGSTVPMAQFKREISPLLVAAANRDMKVAQAFNKAKIADASELGGLGMAYGFEINDEGTEVTFG